jgi:hypothetical protein
MTGRVPLHGTGNDCSFLSARYSPSLRRIIQTYHKPASPYSQRAKYLISSTKPRRPLPITTRKTRPTRLYSNANVRLTVCFINNLGCLTSSTNNNCCDGSHPHQVNAARYPQTAGGHRPDCKHCRVQEPQISCLLACSRLECARLCCYASRVSSWLVFVRRMAEDSNWLSRLEDSLTRNGGTHQVNGLGDGNNI